MFGCPLLLLQWVGRRCGEYALDSRGLQCRPNCRGRPPRGAAAAFGCSVCSPAVHQVSKQYGAAILQNGYDYMCASTTAFADQQVYADVFEAAGSTTGPAAGRGLYIAQATLHQTPRRAVSQSASQSFSQSASKPTSR